VGLPRAPQIPSPPRRTPEQQQQQTAQQQQQLEARYIQLVLSVTRLGASVKSVLRTMGNRITEANFMEWFGYIQEERQKVNVFTSRNPQFNQRAQSLYRGLDDMQERLSNAVR
jgi:hypothetical protein